MHDSALNVLFPYLQATSAPTLWFADENVMPLLQQLEVDTGHLYIICNRYDIYQLATSRGFVTEYNDFNPVSYRQTPARILYRVSKEKSLVHYLLGLSAQYLHGGGELVLTGQKQDGVKSYHDKLLSFVLKGHLKKRGGGLCGSLLPFLPTGA